MENDLNKSIQLNNLKELPESVKKAVKHINRSNPLPLYQQLFSILRDLIISKVLEQGSFFATESLLQEETQVSRSTIRKALEELVRQKHLIRITGKGTFVSINAPEETINLPELKSMSQDLKERGMIPGSKILEVQRMVPSSSIAKKLNLNSTEEVLLIKRVRTGNEIPILYVCSYIPLKVGIKDFENIPESLYQFIKEAGNTIHSATHYINASIIPAEITKLLGVEKSTAGLAIERLTYNDQRSPVIYEEGVFRSDLYSYTITMINKK